MTTEHYDMMPCGPPPCDPFFGVAELAELVVRWSQNETLLRSIPTEIPADRFLFAIPVDEDAVTLHWEFVS